MIDKMNENGNANPNKQSNEARQRQNLSGCIASIGYEACFCALPTCHSVVREAGGASCC
jgi:hypothetical protein